jgi:hypothetical protein
VASNDRNPADDEAVEGSWSPKRSSKAGKAGKAGKDAAPDPDALVDEIEKTREELAETLDAIADKVSPKRVAGRTKKAAKDGAAEAVESVKQTASGAADKAKEAASHAAEAAKEGVAAVQSKVAGDSDPAGSPLTAPLAGAAVPVQPAPTPGALADASFVAVEPAGSETPSYGSSLPPASPSRTPMLVGAGAALLVLLVVLKRRKR